MTVAFALVGVGFLSLISDTKIPGEGLALGNKAPQIKDTLLNGSYFNLEDCKGKMVLIDFWASYDAGSRIENHTKASLLETFADKNFLKGKGFLIVSISLDRFKTPLTRAIEADMLGYPYHICDYNGRESKVVKTYQAQDLKKYLIDGEGRIVAVANNLEPISETLKQLERN
jgi:thiol-disulfide isomerase/thioredoxin